MTQYAMVIDIDKCTGCYNCFLSCRDEYAGNDHLPYSAAQPNAGHYWMNIKELERGSYPKVKVSYLPLPCLHCEEAPCITASPEGSVHRRPDGIVLIDPEKAKGHQDIVNNCPHRLIYWNEKKNLPQKCTMCAHLLDTGCTEPRCVEACPTGALVFGDLDDKSSEIAALFATTLIEDINSNYELKPRVLYLGLPKRFVSGEVVLSNRQHECAKGVTVTLIQGDRTRVAKTDDYGDFEFTGLTQEEFSLTLEYPGYTTRILKDRSKKEVCLGEIFMQPSP